MNATSPISDPIDDPVVARSLARVKEMVQACIQCGTCTGSCPNAFAMDHTPRRMWRMVLMDRTDELFAGRTFALCSACYFCTLRCPRGLPLTEAVSALKQIGARLNSTAGRSGTVFYKCFLESVRRHGRVRETEMMALYFTAMKNPLLPLRFTPLGWKLMKKRKISVHLPSKGQGRLNAIFRKCTELEERP